MNARSLRNILGTFATGVTVVTAIDPDGNPIGLTVNSFASVSLSPPLMLWSLSNESHNYDSFIRASHHCINILASDQIDISNRFAMPSIDRFAGLRWKPGGGGVPVIDGCHSHFEARNEAQRITGDHVVFFNQIERFHHSANTMPLIFHSGRYRSLAE